MAEPRVHFQAAVEGLREQMLQVGLRAEEMVDLAVRSYFRNEPSLTSDVLSRSEEMNQTTLEIDEILLKLFSSKALTTSDARQLMAYVKVNFNLESINRLAFNTANLALSYRGTKHPIPANIPKVGLAAARLVHVALEAFIRNDGDLAVTVRNEGDVISLMGNEAWLEMVAKIRTSPEVLNQALCALMVVRSFEAIVSHAKAIAESVLIWSDGIEQRRLDPEPDQMISPNSRLRVRN
jgi:phosphate transport system protein